MAESPQKLLRNFEDFSPGNPLDFTGSLSRDRGHRENKNSVNQCGRRDHLCLKNPCLYLLWLPQSVVCIVLACNFSLAQFPPQSLRPITKTPIYSNPQSQYTIYGIAPLSRSLMSNKNPRKRLRLPHKNFFVPRN